MSHDQGKEPIDAVALKRQIQAKLMEEWEGLSIDEICEQIERSLAESDDPFVRKMLEKKPSPPVHRLKGERIEPQDYE